MKKLAFILAFCGLMAGVSLAQDQVRDRDQDRIQLREHVMLQDGQMYQIRNGERMQLQNQLKLNNGVAVNPNGTYQSRNGKQLQLRDGECLDMDGKKYRNEERYMHRMERMEKQHMRNENTNRHKGPRMNKSGATNKMGKRGN